MYGIVKQSGGFIWVYGELGIGTTFRIYFPRVETRARTTCDLYGAHATLDLHGSETVLLVEDESAVRHLAGEFLKRCGYTVIEAKDGLQAVEAAARHQGAH